MSQIAATLADLRAPIASVRPYPGNPRRHDLAAIKASLERNGQYRPIVVNRRTDEALAGNGTLTAALELGWDEIARTFVDVDDEAAARIVLVDNRSNDLATYDDGELAALLASLPDFEGTAWADRDVERLLADVADAGADAGRDTAPSPPPANPVSRPGDVWKLGGHRVACGDCTDADAVGRLVGLERLEMVWTDPPYGVDYADAQGRGMTGDDGDGEALYRTLRASLELAAGSVRAGGAIYVMHGDVALHGGTVFRHALVDAGWELHQVLVWVKQAFAFSRQDYHWQHEPILYGWKPGAGHRWNGDAAQGTVIDDDVDLAKLGRRELVALVRELRNERHTTVLREDRPHVADLHPTMKPVALVARMIANSSRRGEAVYEPFGGSGTTVIACENLGRRCYALEVDPGYCDVIVDRWREHTGGEPELDRSARKRGRHRKEPAGAV